MKEADKQITPAYFYVNHERDVIVCLLLARLFHLIYNKHYFKGIKSLQPIHFLCLKSGDFFCIHLFYISFWDPGVLII